MAHLKKDDINFDKLETGVQKAMEADNLYWLQNEAKFRAVKQKGSYDEFKEIVAAAHLKPLDKGDKLQFEDKIVSPWNVAANGQTSVKLEQSTNQSESWSVPKTSNEFTLQWRRKKSLVDKKLYVHQIISAENGPQILKAIFKNEIPFGLLGELARILNSERDDYDKNLLHDTLKCLTETRRFSMSLTFLSLDEKEALKMLIDYLVSEGLDCTNLKSGYSL